jgi:hypothetical protein
LTILHATLFIFSFQATEPMRRRIEPFAHLNVTSSVQNYAGFVETDVMRVGNSANGDKDIAPFQKRRPR